MNKKKLIPIIFIVILSIVAITLLISVIVKKNNNSDKNAYTKLVVKYNNETKEYTDLTKTAFIMVGDQKFFLGSVEPKRVIIYTNKNVQVDKKDYEDVEINGGKEYKICLADNDCFTITYSR